MIITHYVLNENTKNRGDKHVLWSIFFFFFLLFWVQLLSRWFHISSSNNLRLTRTEWHHPIFKFYIIVFYSSFTVFFSENSSFSSEKATKCRIFLYNSIKGELKQIQYGKILSLVIFWFVLYFISLMFLTKILSKKDLNVFHHHFILFSFSFYNMLLL